MFRFTIRELVLLTVAVALAVGWWLDHRSLAKEVRYLEWDLERVLPKEEPVSPLP